ncbi:ABC transporter ATP-binding protein [Candidatus Thorarchaeota archaeon]|nr:MAG: ABC transporter ATP-binding protein [Candidatus Thorarchaeota archaeon]
MPEHADEYVLKVENLRAAYTSKRGLVHAVNDVSFGIRRGESVGLFGESGAGKSSVALAILGIFEKTAKFGSASGDKENKRLWELREKARKEGKTSDDIGEKLPGVEGHIWYKGEDLLALNEEEFRKIRGNEITYVPQGTMKSLNPYTNIQLQTAESLWAHDDESVLYEREVLRRVLQVLDLVEIGDIDIRKALKPKEFSMGEDQRVLIAMALIMVPEILIADEPTTALDVGVQGRIMDAINLVREKLDLTMLLITNDQGLMAETADRIAVMSAGRIMEFADAETILMYPGHPFTRAFLMSNPSMEMIRRIREKGLILRGIPGSPPDMTNPPSGCPFHPRCQYKRNICVEQVPEYREVEDDHWIFCHRYEELPEF